MHSLKIRYFPRFNSTFVDWAYFTTSILHNRKVGISFFFFLRQSPLAVFIHSTSVYHDKEEPSYSLETLVVISHSRAPLITQLVKNLTSFKTHPWLFILSGMMCKVVRRSYTRQKHLYTIMLLTELPSLIPLL